MTRLAKENGVSKYKFYKCLKQNKFEYVYHGVYANEDTISFDSFVMEK